MNFYSGLCSTLVKKYRKYMVFWFYSSKGSTLSKRGCKKTESSGKGDENSRGLEAPVQLEDMERNQKILQWMMEGEALRHKKSSHG